MTLADHFQAAREEERTAAVLVRGLHKKFGSVQVLAGLNLTIKQGQIAGVLGPNGAGKTTLLNVVQGMIPFDLGEVSVHKLDVAREPSALRKLINVAMQPGALPPNLTPRELVDLYLKIYADRGDPGAVLATMELEHKGDERIGHLSAGQKQRVTIALALIGQPRLVLLDEPTSDLDPQSRLLVWQLLRDYVKARGCTIVLTTQQMDEAERLCDEVAILDGGTIVTKGTRRKLLEEHCPGIQLTFSANEKAIAYCRAQHAVALTEEKDGMRIRLSFGSTAAALSAMHDLMKLPDGGVADVHFHIPTLEDVFVKLTGRSLRGH